ncbi:ASST-domain-containing protein [Aspergillus egyptiacus]|nr:ASST-domain-containing protein [Aspergillus egyptiacus]
MLCPFLLSLASSLSLVHASDLIYPEPDGSGLWPTKIYRSTSVLGPYVYFTARDSACDDDEYTFLSPRGEGVAVRGPTILGQNGELVWSSQFKYERAYNLDVHTYKGQDYLTFWAGDENDNGHGDGTIFMLDSSYNEAYTIRGPSGFSADSHEFRITREETALFTIYDAVSADLRSVQGPQNGWIWDCRFVEVDIETNDVLFEWRASEHFNFTQVARSPGDTGRIFQDAWDFFHISSVDKDDRGNYLISALNTDHLTYVDGRTGDIIWRLGGNQSDFKDVSATSGAASAIAWPHDARFRDNGTAITLFDNTSPGNNANRGVYLDLDQSAMTVSLRHGYLAPEYNMTKPTSQRQSQGSVQILNNGNVLVSYGLNGAAWSEFDNTGVLRCHALFGPAPSFGTGRPVSYRVSKRPWKGYPATTPDFEIFDDEAVLSWNGATEVAKWVLEGLDSAYPTPYPNEGPYGTPEKNGEENDDDQSVVNPFFITESAKTGFETTIHIPYTPYHFLRVRALSADGTHLGTTAILPYNFTSDPKPTPAPTPHAQSTVLFFTGVFVIIALVALLYIFRRCCCGLIRRRFGRYQPQWWGGDEDYDPEEQADWEEEVGVYHMSDGDSDDSDVEISVLENPRLSPMFAREGSWLGSDAGDTHLSASPRPGLSRSSSTTSTASARLKQH